MRTYIKPEIFYINKLPSLEQIRVKGEDCIVIYDLMLNEIPEFKNWLTMFDYSYGVMGGEALKSVNNFPTHFNMISQKIVEASRIGLKVVAVGGGSIGDFAGFFASVYKRGVSLIQVPTTWLSVVDSAHGGKNALNSSHSKNQLGTFYFPSKVFICKGLLSFLPEDQVRSGYGEVIKTALLSGDPLWSSLSKTSSINLNELWELLPAIVDYKYSIVEKDPFESSNIRRVLNFGHTLGHILEKKFNLLHGVAVAQGLHFSLDWSLEKKYIEREEYKKIKSFLTSLFPCLKEKFSEHLTKEEALKLLLTDKKLDLDQEINFVFFKSLGEPFVEKTKVFNVVAKLYQHSWIS